MAHFIKYPSWRISERHVTSEQVYLNRRKFLKAMGMSGLIGAGFGGCSLTEGGPAGAKEVASQEKQAGPQAEAYPPLPEYKRNPAYAEVDRPLTGEKIATSYNNFYEFSFGKHQVKELAADFVLNPYALEVEGLVDKPRTFGLDDIEKLGYEERIYRFRCVEAWSMTIPWLGVPLKKLIELAGVQNGAKYVEFTSFMDPEQAPNQRSDDSYPWPYYEALTLEEAMNELTFVTTGAYGKRLQPQSGSPLRLIIPWKYGFKGPKSVVRMTFTAERPPTFWSDVSSEYTWTANVEPERPHPRWSQAKERHITDSMSGEGELIPTRKYNGYGEQVARLYEA